jgi:hypothetical protein
MAAAREGNDDWEGPLPEPANDDLEWDCLLDCLPDRILWDADYEMGREFLDADPDVSRELLHQMRIGDGYYLALAPDPRDEELEQIRRRLRELTGRPEPGSCWLAPVRPSKWREADCRLVREIVVLGADGFDCSYEQWARLFRDEVRQAAALPPPIILDPAAVLSAEQQVKAARARQSNSAPGAAGRQPDRVPGRRLGGAG